MKNSFHVLDVLESKAPQYEFDRLSSVLQSPYGKGEKIKQLWYVITNLKKEKGIDHIMVDTYFLTSDGFVFNLVHDLALVSSIMEKFVFDGLAYNYKPSVNRR